MLAKVSSAIESTERYPVPLLTNSTLIIKRTKSNPNVYLNHRNVN